MIISSLLSSLKAAGCNIDELWAAHPGRAIRARARQLIFHEMDPCDSFYVLLEGELRSFVGDSGARRTTLLQRAPAVLGDRDIIADVVAQESAQALVSCRILVWPRPTLLDEWQTDSLLRRWLGSDLVHRYAKATGFNSFSSAQLTQRVAMLLCERAQAGEHRLPPASSIAETVSGTSKSVLRSLSALRRAGALSTEDAGDFQLHSGALDEFLVAGIEGLFHSLVDPPSV